MTTERIGVRETNCECCLEVYYPRQSLSAHCCVYRYRLAAGQQNVPRYSARHRWEALRLRQAFSRPDPRRAQTCARSSKRIRYAPISTWDCGGKDL